MKTLLALFLLISQSALSVNYYVSNAGTGSGNGLTTGTPWTFAQLNASTLPGAGDSVHFNRGETFYGVFVQRSFVKYKDYGTGAKPLFTGLQELTGWLQQTTGLPSTVVGNIYYASFTAPINPTVSGGAYRSNLNLVTYDGTVAQEGRFPDVGSTLLYESGTATTLTDAQLTGSWVGAEVAYRVVPWVVNRYRVSAQSGTTLTFRKDQNYNGGDAGGPTAYTNYDYIIKGHLGTLTQPGEWYYDSAQARVYVNFGVGGSPSGHTVKAASLFWIAHLNGLTNVTFENLAFEGSNAAAIQVSAQTSTTNRHVINNCEFWSHGRNAVNVTQSLGVTVSNAIIRDCMNNGVNANGSDSIFVQDTKINNSGIRFGAGYSDGGPSQCGIAFQFSGSRAGKGNSAYRNEIVSSGYCGIWFDGPNAFMVNNFVDSTGHTMFDGAHIYSVTSSAPNPAYTNREIVGNILLNGLGVYSTDASNTKYTTAGLYIDDYAQHMRIHGNFIANGGWHGLFIKGAGYITATDNTVYNFPWQTHYTWTVADMMVNVNISGNKYINKTTSQKTLFIWEYTEDPPAGWGTWVNNIYANPENPTGNHILWWREYVTATQDFNTTTWRTASGKDVGSTNSLFTAAPGAEQKVIYNKTGTAVAVSLASSYRDVANTLYNTGSITLQPYSGAVLFASTDTYTPPPSGPGKIKKTVGGKLAISGSGKLLVSAIPVSAQRMNTVAPKVPIKKSTIKKK